MAGFKRKCGNPGGKHRWINYPNTSVRKCTKCGVVYRRITRNNENIVTYELNGVVYDTCPECREDNL